MSTGTLQEVLIENYDDFYKKIDELKETNPSSRIFIFFNGNPENENSSWCPDCRDFEELLSKIRQELKPIGILLRVQVGTRLIWKNSENPYRQDGKLLIKSIPTIIEWNTGKRLADTEAKDYQKVKLLFENN